MSAAAAGAPSPASAGDSFSVDRAMLGWMRDLAPYGIFSTDAELCIRSWNRWMTEHSNRESAEVLGRPLVDVFPELLERRLVDPYVRALRGEASVLSTALHKHLLTLPAAKHTTAAALMLQTARIGPLHDRGAIIGTITVIEDVTQRETQTRAIQRQQNIDRLLSQALGALLASNDPVRDVAEILLGISPSLGVDAYFHYVRGSDGRHLRLHASSGMPPRPKETLTELALAEGMVDAAALRVLGEALAAAGLQQQFSFPLVIGDRLLGLLAFASYSPDRIDEENQGVLARIAQYAAIVLDRAWREEEIRAASKAKDDFLAALSHELRAPLNPVLLVASDGAINDAFDPAAREAFSFIEKNALLEARLIDDLLDITRIEHRKLPLERRPLDVHDAIRDAIVTVRQDISERGIELQLDLQAKQTTVFGDEVRIRQVFWNVLKNAVKFTEAGGTVRVRSQVAGDEIVVEVIDSGIGMEPHEVTQLFAAFAQGDHAKPGGSHRFGGLGLGLAISHRLLDLHGGAIEASSDGRNQGSTFRIRLPLLRKAPPDPVSSGSDRPDENPSRSETVDRKAQRLLVVEDHEPTRATLERLLKSRGFVVTAVGTADAALSVASARAFDLVLSDIGLPDSDGFALMKTLRDSHGLRGIALSGYGMDSDLARGRRAGFVTHLVKPIRADVLSRALDEVLGPRPAAGEPEPADS